MKLSTDLSVRSATSADACQLLEIYRPIVLDSAVSFETIPPTQEEFARRIEATNKTHAWLVAEAPSRVAGYAYATPHRSRDAYRYSVETSVYVHSDCRGQGVGTLLYRRLLKVLAELDYYHAYAGITLPNPASVTLHESLGFEAVGVFRSIGFKFNEWHDVSWWYRQIRQGKPR